MTFGQINSKKKGSRKWFIKHVQLFSVTTLLYWCRKANEIFLPVNMLKMTSDVCNKRHYLCISGECFWDLLNIHKTKPRVFSLHFSGCSQWCVFHTEFQYFSLIVHTSKTWYFFLTWAVIYRKPLGHTGKVKKNLQRVPLSHLFFHTCHCFARSLSSPWIPLGVHSSLHQMLVIS